MKKKNKRLTPKQIEALEKRLENDMRKRSDENFLNRRQNIESLTDVILSDDLSNETKVRITKEFLTGWALL